jgi:hypothetical protein
MDEEEDSMAVTTNNKRLRVFFELKRLRVKRMVSKKYL